MNIYPAGTNARIVKAGLIRNAGDMIIFILIEEDDTNDSNYTN